MNCWHSTEAGSHWLVVWKLQRHCTIYCHGYFLWEHLRCYLWSTLFSLQGA